MIKAQTPGAATVRVDLPGSPFDPSGVGSVILERGESMHDAAVLELTGLNPKALTIYLDRPVRIDVTLNAYASTTFVGYINHIEPESVTAMGLVNRSPIQRAKVYCLGSSRVMRGKRTKVWDGYTLPELVRSLAHEYRLSFSVPNDSYRTRFIQRSESDFELLTKATGRLGYKVTVHGTHIHVWDPAKFLGRGLPWAQLTALSGNGQADASFAPGRILSINGSFGLSGHRGDAHTKRLSFLDADGNALRVDDDDVAQDAPPTGLPVHSAVEDHYVIKATSYTEAKRTLGGAVKDNYPYHLTAQVTGIPFLVPGSVAEVTGHGGYYDGVWMVRSVKHEIVRSNFVTELTMSRDTTNMAPARLPTVDHATPPPEPVLLDGQWRSSFTSEDIYV